MRLLTFALLLILSLLTTSCCKRPAIAAPRPIPPPPVVQVEVKAPTCNLGWRPMPPLLDGGPDPRDPQQRSSVTNASIADATEYVLAAEARMDAADACLRTRPKP